MTINQKSLLLIGHGSRNVAATAEYKELAAQLATRLDVDVEPCFLEFADPPIVDGIRTCIERGSTQIVALPLFLGPAGHQKNDVPAVINWARTEWPQLTIHYGTPLGAQYPLVSVLSDRLDEVLADATSEFPVEETAVIVMGRGSRDPDSNSDVPKLARLLYEGCDFLWVETAYFSLAKPSLPDVIARCAKLGARRVVVLPYLLFTGRIHQQATEQAEAAAKACGIDVLMANYLFPHPQLLDAIVQRYEEAVEGIAAMTCDLCKYRVRMSGFEREFGLPQTSDYSHGLRGVPHVHGFEAKLDALLPPQYKNGESTGVSAAPMGAADLKTDVEGKVAWDEMWEDFCDLALAGGPSHRGELLEPIDPQLVKLNPSGYANALAEIERGLRLVTGLEVVQSKSPGWIGLRCHSDEMAIWLLRAIVVENIFVRREGATLYFPVGPQYQLEGEIKSIITVAAKTNHYWIEHMAGQAAAEAKI